MTTKERNTFEQTVISSILKSKELFMEVFNFCHNNEAFMIRENRLLFDFAVEYFYEYGKEPGLRTLNQHLVSKENGGRLKEYLKDHIVNAEYALNPVDYVRRLLDDNINHEINDAVKTTGGPGFDRAIALNESIGGIITKYTSNYSRVLTNAEVGRRVYEDLEKAVKGEHSDYIPTGFKTLDKDIVGIPKRDLTIVASRPGMGKSQFMVALLRNFIKQGIKCGIFSLEMSVDSLWHRLLAAETGINALKIERGDLSEEEMKKIKSAIGELSKDNYIIDDNGHQTPESIKAKISLWKAKSSLEVVMVDYLTLIDYSCDERRNDLNIGKLTKNLRAFSKKTGIPIVFLSQLNRAVESRVDKRPQMQDLRESGDIEQDAATVMFIYRPSYYGLDSFKDSKERYMTKEGFMLKSEEYAEIIIRKARSGITGAHPMRCVLSLQRFEEVTPAYASADLSSNYGQ